MGFKAIFQAENWTVPFHFWSMIFFVLGAIVGSFLNVCIYRVPRGLSVVHPPSHCPKCSYSIPWYLNVPLVTWLWLRGRCANCRERISARYFGVELLTALAFMASWMGVGERSAGLALVYCVVLAGFIAATFIDFEHFIIPDGLTIGGMVAGFLCSLAVPMLHGESLPTEAMKKSVLGMVVGAGVIYLILRGGKLLFGRERIALPPESKVIFTETSLILPNQEILFEDIFYRKGDTIRLEARRVELVDRCCWSVPVRLRPDRLEIGTEVLDPEKVPYLEVMTDRVELPREAMGLGDVKFMAAIGAFLGASATVFSLLMSSLLGGVVGLTLILMRKREWSSQIPYGPYIAAAAVWWMFGGDRLFRWWVSGGWLPGQ